MRRLIVGLLLTLAAGAVLGWLSRWGQEGVVSFFVRQTRLDLSLNLFVLLSIVFFIVGYILVRLLGLFLHLPDKARAWRRSQEERIAYDQFKEAVMHFLEGRFLKAGRVLQPLFKCSDSGLIARLMAAQAAHEIRNFSQRDAYIQALEDDLPRVAEQSQRRAWKDILLMRRAHWALQGRDAQEALMYLNQLSPASNRKVLALRAKLKAAQLAGQTHTALDTARLLARHGAFSESVARSLLHSLMHTLLIQAPDAPKLLQIWRAWSSSDRADALLACSFANKIHTFALQAEAQEAKEYRSWARQALLAVAPRYALWPDSIQWRWVEALHKHWLGIDSEAIAQIEQLQISHPADAPLQGLLGSLTLHLGLWGKASALFKQALKSPALPPRLCYLAWRALADLAQREGNQEQSKHALEQALTALEASTQHDGK